MCRTSIVVKITHLKYLVSLFNGIQSRGRLFIYKSGAIEAFVILFYKWGDQYLNYLTFKRKNISMINSNNFNNNVTVFRSKK